MSNATVVDTLRDLIAQYKAVKAIEPRNDDEARRRSSELIRLGGLVDELKRKANAASAEQRVANGGSDGGVTAANLRGEVIDVLAKSVAPAIRDLRQEVASLERRITAREADEAVREGRRAGTWQGEWSPKRTYEPWRLLQRGRNNVGMPARRHGDGAGA